MSGDGEWFLRRLLDKGEALEISLEKIEAIDSEIHFNIEGLPGALACSGIKESLLRNASAAHKTTLSVVRSHLILEDFLPKWSVYGQMPLADPYRFFLEFSRVVEEEYGKMRDVRDYLNWGKSQQDWLQFVYSRSYHLFEGPKSLAEKCQSVLDAQAVTYMVLPPKASESAAPMPKLMLLRCGESHVICEGITAK